MEGIGDLKKLLLELADADIEFILVGGLAAVLHGVPLATFDLDVVHLRTPGNVARIESLLAKLGASTRLRPAADRLVPKADALLGPGHQLLRTSLGPLDLLGVVEGGLDYGNLLPQAQSFTVEGRTFLVLSLQALADLKAKASSPKDQLSRLLILETLAQLDGSDTTS